MRVVAAAAVVLCAAAGPAAADNCSQLVGSVGDLNDPFIIQDCIRTGGNWGRIVGVTVGGTALVVTLVGLPGKDPPRPGRDPKEPRDRDECGAELASLDGQLNSALTRARNAADEYARVRREKLDFEVQAAEVRSKAAQIRAAISQAEGLAYTAVFKGVFGGAFWAAGAKALILTGSVAAIAAGWGIRAWRGYEMLGLLDTLWNGVKVDVLGEQRRVPITQLPTFRAWAQNAAAAAEAAALLPDLRAQLFNTQLAELRAASDTARAEADRLYADRRRVHDRCQAAGNLPPGTWNRPPPDYTFDSEGALISVGY